MRWLILFISFVLWGCQQVPTKLYVRSDCKSVETSFQDQDFTVEVQQYTGISKSDRAILIMPPTGGSTILDRSMAGIS